MTWSLVLPPGSPDETDQDQYPRSGPRPPPSVPPPDPRSSDEVTTPPSIPPPHHRLCLFSVSTPLSPVINRPRHSSSRSLALFTLCLRHKNNLFFLKRHQRDGKTCPHTHTGGHHNHGCSRTGGENAERERGRERWMFTFLRASASLIGQMNDFIVRLRLAAFLPSRLLFLPSFFF